MAARGPHCCACLFSSWSKQGLLCCGVWASRCGDSEHRLQAQGLRSCGRRARLSHGVWDLLRPGAESVFPALSGGFPATGPPRKPVISLFCFIFLFITIQNSIFLTLFYSKNFACASFPLECKLHEERNFQNFSMIPNVSLAPRTLFGSKEKQSDI